MLLQIQPSATLPSTTTLTIVPDVGSYALVTMDGDQAGTYAVRIA